MTEGSPGRWRLSTLSEAIEDFSHGERPEDKEIAHVLADITSSNYTNYVIEGNESDPESVMHGMLYITQGEPDLRFGCVSFAPNISAEQLRPRFIEAIDNLTSSWFPARCQTYNVLQQIIQERYQFRTLAAMILAHGITENGSKESVSVAFPTAFREVIALPTEKEKTTSGIFLAGSFLKRIPFGR